MTWEERRQFRLFRSPAAPTKVTENERLGQCLDYWNSYFQGTLQYLPEEKDG